MLFGLLLAAPEAVVVLVAVLFAQIRFFYKHVRLNQYNFQLSDFILKLQTARNNNFLRNQAILQVKKLAFEKSSFIG